MLVAGLVLSLAALVAAPPEPTAPTSVAIQLRRTSDGQSVELTCRSGAATCQRARRGPALHVDDALAWSALAPIVDDIAGSPLMRAGADADRRFAWRVRIGAAVNARAEALPASADAVTLWEVVADDPVARPGHAAAEVSAERLGGDPAAQLETVAIHCQPDAIWCRVERTPTWLHPRPAAVQWRALKWLADGTSELFRADAFVVAPGETSSVRWSWRLALGGVTNAHATAATLGPESFGWLRSLLRLD
ncbi:MAG: hypothetical protein U1F43_05110 [Myxococcota bacterium]